MASELKLWNGRTYSVLAGSCRSGAHLYIAAYSVADARRVCVEAGFNDPGASEINTYWSKGAWGNAMNGVPVERGIWIQRDKACVPERVIPGTPFNYSSSGASLQAAALALKQRDEQQSEQAEHVAMTRFDELLSDLLREAKISTVLDDAYQAKLSSLENHVKSLVAQSKDCLGRLVQGMAVSVDISTGDSEAGKRYFGTIADVLETPSTRHGLTLLVTAATSDFEQLSKGEES